MYRHMYMHMYAHVHVHVPYLCHTCAVLVPYLCRTCAVLVPYCYSAYLGHTCIMQAERFLVIDDWLSQEQIASAALEMQNMVDTGLLKGDEVTHRTPYTARSPHATHCMLLVPYVFHTCPISHTCPVL